MQRADTAECDQREYRRLSDWVSRSLPWLLGRADMTPAEVATELWLAMARRETGWESPEHFQNWLHVTAHHILVDRLRKLGKARVVGDEDPTRYGSRSLANAEREETSFQVRDAIERMQRVHPRPASVVSLRYLEGYTVPECAGRLGVSERTVKRESRRAFSWLRGQFLSVVVLLLQLTALSLGAQILYAQTADTPGDDSVLFAECVNVRFPAVHSSTVDDLHEPSNTAARIDYDPKPPPGGF